MTTIINLFGGPGTGKSSTAANLFYQAKAANISVELVREYVKSWAWEGRKIDKYDQIYFTGKQSRQESLLFDKVDYIITDSPVFLGAYYAKKYTTLTIAKGILSMVTAYYDQCTTDGHSHINIFLERSKEYNPKGRYETEDQALEIDRELKIMLVEQGYTFKDCSTIGIDLAAIGLIYK